MALFDWVIVGLYVISAIWIGAIFTKKAANSTTDFFLAGRSLSWAVAGTSIVATTFSADTPLFVAGMSRSTGIFSNWFWWSGAIGGVATVFFFARLWRRTEVVTDLEFLVKRYSDGKATSILRGFKVFFDGILVNSVVMATVTLAMSKIIKVLLNLPDSPVFTVPLLGGVTWTTILLFILGTSAVLYSCMSGLYGVVYTDLVQFALAMVGSITLAAMVYIDASKGEGVIAKIASSPDFRPEILRFSPDVSVFNLASFTFFIYVFMMWWAVAPGNGYFVQRLLACRTEKDSLLAFLWFNICHYIVRPWPWIIVGLLSMYYLPDLKDPESAFPGMIDLFLPVGLKGVMVASMLAAFMSTIDTQLNLGTSYLINDLYKPFIRPGKSSSHYVLVSRISMLCLTVLALIVTTKLTSILDAYKYLALMMSGIGTVMIARWYWWRVNAYSEVSALIGSFVIGNVMQFVLPSTAESDYFAIRIAVTTVVVSVIWVVVTLLTSKNDPDQKVIDFYKKMRISGPGWAKVREIAGVEPVKDEMKNNVIAWLSCVTFLYSILLGIGKILLHSWMAGLVCLVIAVVSGLCLKTVMKNMSMFGENDIAKEADCATEEQNSNC